MYALSSASKKGGAAGRHFVEEVDDDATDVEPPAASVPKRKDKEDQGDRKSLKKVPSYSLEAPKDTSTFDTDREHEEAAVKVAAAASSLQKQKAPALDTAVARNKNETEVKEKEEEEKCEIEDTTEPVVNLSSGLFAANMQDVPSEPATTQGITAPMDPISSEQPGAFHVAGINSEMTGLDSVVMEEESVAPTVETTSSKKLVEAWKVGPEQDTSDDLEAQVQQRLAEVLRNAPIAEVGEAPTVPEEAKPNKRRLIISVLLLLAVFAAIGTAIGISLRNKTETPAPVVGQSPTSAPLSEQFPLAKQVANVCRAISGDAIDDVNSPQYAAFEWIVGDVSETHSSETDILSDEESQAIATRYVAAVLYFSMNMSDEKNWTDSYNFLSQEHVCTWRNDTVARGIGCDGQDHIISLILPSSNLNGTIPSEIEYLSTLKEVDLSGNALITTIPESIFGLPFLRDIKLTRNALSGQIPRTIKDASELEQLWLSNNILTGDMPDSLGISTTLKSLKLDLNELTGIIPPFAKNSSLEELFLGFNDFGGVVGSIPATIERLSNLRALSLRNNSFTGTIPSFIQALTKLEELQLDNNTFTGSIPSEIGQLTALEFLNLRNNKLNGTIPSEIDLLTDLKLLSLDGGGNNFSGPIPPEIGTNGTIDESLFSLIASSSLDGGGALGDSASPQFKAAVWLTNNRFLSNYTDSQKLQRYAMATLYFSTGGDLWFQQDKWLSDEPECDWFNKGVTFCDLQSKGVSNFDLNNNNLVGSIPPEIGYFSNLKNLDMANNSLVGILPGSLVNLTRLEYLNLTENALTGTLPKFLFTHPQLRHLRLDDNAFSGTLSSSLGTSPRLQVVWARNNGLSGLIPISVGKSTVLRTINLHGNFLIGVLPTFSVGSNIWSFYVGENELVGTVPTSIGNLKLLEGFAAHANSLDGPIPSEIGQCTNLRDLFLYNNTFMTGILPTELGSLPLMRYLYLGDNRFEGGIPSELGNLRLLQELSLHDNRFNGTIPTELRGCASLVYMDFASNYLNGNLGAALDLFPRILHTFDVSENQLTGTIPTWIGEFSSLEWFDVQSNKLVGTIPTEVGSLSLLETFVVAYNGFNGTVPSILASLPKLTTLRVQGNELTGDLNAFCGFFESLVGNVCSEPDKLECPCCTHCCRVETGYCEPL